MRDYKFYWSWLISTVVMLGLSYLCHGVFLNDIYLLKYPINVFVIAAVLAYLMIGFIINFLIYNFSQESPSYLKDLRFGALVGAGIYLLAFVFGISFHANVEIPIMMFDLTWQVIEQTLGGLAGGFAFRFLYNVDYIKASAS